MAGHCSMAMPLRSSREDGAVPVGRELDGLKAAAATLNLQEWASEDFETETGHDLDLDIGLAGSACKSNSKWSYFLDSQACL